MSFCVLVMLPFLSFGRWTLPTYSLMILLGAAAAWLYFHRRLRVRGENPGQAEQAFWFALLGALVGAKVLYLLPRLPQLLADLPLVLEQRALFAARYLTGGFVFYGGLLGALGSVWLFCRVRKLSFARLTADLVPAVPLFHAFGRIGCLLAGCCHGIPAPAGCWGVTSVLVPEGTVLVPVQGLESLGCLLLFLLLDRLARRGWQGDRLLVVYLCLYAPLRFGLEFLRGDAARGFLGPLSTSQVLALGTFAAALAVFLWQRRRTRPPA